ncbi:hypothetical protein Taro_020427 [Colocasia esculenta]|uniref:Uncharacterized protein n=1 Tax=Colocasia esculenta TaxID=4460 RepID=A0A843UYR9_COLES|nr:hypothetical protein [Colocasia esculenta]
MCWTSVSIDRNRCYIYIELGHLEFARASPGPYMGERPCQMRGIRGPFIGGRPPLHWVGEGPTDGDLIVRSPSVLAPGKQKGRSPSDHEIFETLPKRRFCPKAYSYVHKICVFICAYFMGRLCPYGDSAPK